VPRFAGWWGHSKARRFEMGPEFEPIAGAEGWQVSNPPVLSTAPLLASLEIFARADITRLREKSLALSRFMRRLIEARLGRTVEIITPAAESAHGSQLSLRLAQAGLTAQGGLTAREWYRRLSAAGVIGDWREPDTLRLAPVPLYNSFGDVARAVDALARTAVA
jgi:kynureninase